MRLQIFIFIHFFSGILNKPFEEFVNVFPNGTQIKLCDYWQASNCFTLGNFNYHSKCMEISEIDGNEKSEILVFNQEYFSKTLSSFHLCLSFNLRNIVASDFGEHTYISSKEMVPNSGQIEEFKKEIEINFEKAAYLDKVRNCKLYKAHKCFKENGCYLKSHYAALPKIMDTCHNEMMKRIMKFPKLPANFETNVSQPSLQSKSMLDNVIEKMEFIEKKLEERLGAMEKREKEMVAIMNFNSFQSVNELKKFAKLD